MYKIKGLKGIILFSRCIDPLRQAACLVVNPIKVNSFAYLFSCATVGRASDRMTVPS